MKRAHFNSGNTIVLTRKPRNKKRSDLKPFKYVDSLKRNRITADMNWKQSFQIKTSHDIFLTVYGKITAVFEDGTFERIAANTNSKHFEKMLYSTPYRLVWGKWRGVGVDIHQAATKLIKNIVNSSSDPNFDNDFTDAAVQEGINSAPSVKWNP